MFADDNSKFTKFLIKNKEAFEHYFKLTKCNQDIDKLYTLQDVYDQITVIVNSVSCLKDMLAMCRHIATVAMYCSLE